MNHAEEKKSHGKSTWPLIRAAYWVVGRIRAVYGWLFPEQETYPENESGRIIRRVLANRSWFDKISAGWVELPFSVKMTAFAGVALISILVGFWVGAPLLLTCATLFLSGMMHASLVAHEYHRIEQAKLFTEEIVALNKELEAHVNQLKEEAEIVHDVADELSAHCAQMKTNAETLEKKAEEIHAQKEEITVLVDEMKEAATDLMAQEKEVHEVLEQTTAHLQTFNTLADKAAQRIEGINAETEKFAEAVSSIQASKKAYAEAATRFGIFVAQLKIPVALELSDEEYKFYNDLQAELDENEILIEKMKRSMICV